VIPHAIEPTGGLFVATASDPPEYAEPWLAACRRLGVPATEMSAAAALRREPLLTRKIARVFQVQDAALDSFELLHALARAVSQSGGVVLTRHRVAGLVPHGDGLLARIVPPAEDSPFQVEARFVVNAAGPFAGSLAAMAGAHLPLALGKGTMVAMASRLTHTVLNRCKPPHDGDIIVPIGTVCVLGTTDVPVRSPTDLVMENWEIDLLLGEGQVLIPTLRRHRALRAWAGIRALYRTEASRALPTDIADRTPAQGGRPVATRALPRAHAVIDHGDSDGVPGLISVIGGKLTTYRKMAEDVIDLIARQASITQACRTAETPLPLATRRYYSLAVQPTRRAASRAPVLCECELVLEDQLRAAVAAGSAELDDLRRDLRLGMGPCQAAFCAYRAAGIALQVQAEPEPDGGLAAFTQERWRGLRPLAWGRGLRQVEFLRRVHLELLGTAVDTPDNE
jgi:glycerol-3-phosphate dehydrogenase